jgi:segregation and condensation protein B
MNEVHLKNVVVAALLAAGRPLQPDELRDLFDEFERPEVDDVKAALAALASEYENRGLELREVANGFRIQVREAVSAPVSRLWQERPQKYSRAFLETLALIAYRQPITRGEIEEIRGVAVNPNIIKTLMERGWVRVVGHREVPGRPEVLGTTREFLDYFGLKSLDDLPTLAQIRDIETLGVQLEFTATAVAPVEAADAQAAPEGGPEVSAEASLDGAGADSLGDDRSDDVEQTAAVAIVSTTEEVVAADISIEVIEEGGESPAVAAFDEAAPADEAVDEQPAADAVVAIEEGERADTEPGVEQTGRAKAVDDEPDARDAGIVAFADDGPVRRDSQD